MGKTSPFMHCLCIFTLFGMRYINTKDIVTRDSGFDSSFFCHFNKDRWAPFTSGPETQEKPFIYVEEPVGL